jgi:hypothetical protein
MSNGDSGKDDGALTAPRLSIAMDELDDGLRPLTNGSERIPWLSPAIRCTPELPRAGEPCSVSVLIRNLGTTDVTGAVLHATYNVWLGNEPEGGVPITNEIIETVPAGGWVETIIDWTPPNVSTTHACLHARVWDTFSLLMYAERCGSWDPVVNPQTASRNLAIVVVRERRAPLLLIKSAKNWSEGKRSIRALVTRVDLMRQPVDPTSRFPLPFRPLHGFTKEFVFRGTAELWPRATVEEHLLHDRFGWRGVDPQGKRQRRKADNKRLAPSRFTLAEDLLGGGRRRDFTLEIPPAELPGDGESHLYQIDYQVGETRPVQTFVRVVGGGSPRKR